MRLVEQVDYRGCTLLRFEQRGSHNDAPGSHSHWIVIGRDGINVLSSALPSEADARAFLGPEQPAGPAGMLSLN